MATNIMALLPSLYQPPGQKLVKALARGVVVFCFFVFFGGGASLLTLLQYLYH